MKIGAHEFEAEGTREAVVVQLETWQRLMSWAMQSNPASTAPATGVAAGPDPAFGQLFGVDAGGKVTLRASLQGRQRNANAALLLLYGWAISSPGGNGWAVTPARLADAMRASGYRLKRVDRALVPHLAGGLVHRGGPRKQPTYALTAAGHQFAAALARRLCGHS